MQLCLCCPATMKLLTVSGVQNVKACPLGRYDPTDSESEAESEAGEEMLLGTHRFLESSLRSDGGSSNGDSQGSDGESDSDVGATRGSVNISSERLLSMHAVASQDSMQKSCYAEHGTCKARVKKALHSPVCSCRCRVPFQTLLRVVMAFWMLSKRGQDTVLWSIQKEDPGSKKDWYIEGGVWK